MTRMVAAHLEAARRLKRLQRALNRARKVYNATLAALLKGKQ